MASLLLISNRPEDAAFVNEAALVSRHDVIIVPTLTEAATRIKAMEGIRGIFVDASTHELFRAFEMKIQDTFGLFSDRVNANQLHYFGSKAIDSLPYLTESPLFGHFITRNQNGRNIDPDDAQHYGRIISATSLERAFGLASFMRPETKIQTVALHNSLQKAKAVEAVRSYLIAAKFQTRIASVIANAADELLMNAIYSAPIDELGKRLFDNMPRSTEMKLEAKNVVEMQLGYDGTRIGITVIDRFGSLDKTKLLSQIAKAYSDTAYRMRISQAGAGVGLSMVAKMGASFFYACEFHERTEATVIFKRTNSYRDFKSQFQFISTQFYF